VASTKDQASVDKNLPIVLPSVPDYLPSSDGYSPLAKNKDWVQTTDQEGRPALRETNTMPNWAGSSWYYLRYIDPKNPHSICDRKKMEYWMPVDRYFGGSEHTTLHLLYSRFWHRFLYDEGVVNTPEPYAWRMNGGVLLGPDSQRMSKSRGNIINPDDKVAAYGADALRLYINFMGPYDGTLPWSENGLKACRRLIDRIYSLREKVQDSANAPEFERSYHKLVKNVSWMIDALKTNTSVSEIMIFVNAAEATPHINRESWRGFIKILAPFAVFAAEDLWQESHGYTAWKPEQSVHLQSWPQFDPKLAIDEFLTLGVQINGKVRDEVQLLPDEPEESVRAKVLELPGVQKWLEGKTPKKFIYIKNRIVNIVA
jgi:leucyl-tRNA synthetase